MYQNYITQNEKIERISDKTLVIGVDIAKDSHYAQVINWRKQEVRKGLSFQNRKDGYEKFLRWMQKALKQTESEDVLVAMEPTGTYYFVFEEYLEQLGIEVAIVNGRDVRRTSEIMGNDSSKNDPRDALIISQLTVDGRYGPSTRPKEGDYAELRELISLRELLATDDIRHKNRLYTQLSQLFPEHQAYQKRGFSIGMLAAMKHFSTLGKLIAAGPEGIYQLWKTLQIKNYGQKKAQALYALARRSIGIKRNSEAAAHKLLKTILYKAAIVLISTNKGFRQIYDYYTIKRKKPLIKMKAVIATSCKLIRVFYAMLKNGTTYDEKKILEDIHRPGSLIR